MKKFKYFAYVGAIALLSVTGFTACSSGDEVVDVPNSTPTFNGESVKTQFTISLPENISKMRMASEQVQYTSNDFRGIDNIKLVPYSLGAAAASGVQGTENPNANLISFSAIEAFDYATSNSKVYADVNLVVGTSNFLFYGKAIDNNPPETAISTADDKFKFGTLTVAGLAPNTQPTLSSVEFTPVCIYNDATDENKAVGANLIAVLNAVANATPKEYDANQQLQPAQLSDTSSPKFKDVTSDQSSSIYNLFDKFKELSVSSSKNVELALLDLCQNLDIFSTVSAKATAPNTYKMAIGIRAAIAEYATITVTSGVTTKVELRTDLANPITGYPANINLPDGSARVKYDETLAEPVFVAATSAEIATGLDVATLDKYVYPANLQYFVNSPVKVSDNVQSPSYETKTWDAILNLYSGSAVTSATRSVALTNQVQYGVARLDANVQNLSSDNTKIYKDYNGDDVNVTNGFTLTGILIGGQKSVGWNFKKKGDAVYTIYDNAIPGGDNAKVVRGSGTAVTNYTLVLETGEETADKTVNVALEFVNNGDSFVGFGGDIIHKGATFYLVGTLKASEGSKQSGASDDVTNRVFTQDCKTVATFTIQQGLENDGTDAKAKGLGTATKGLPDLRTPQMELGLSVDLTWSPGLTFNVNI